MSGWPASPVDDGTFAPPETEWGWLDSTTDLQTNTYGYDLPGMIESPAKAAPYLMWNLFAAFIELAELSIEFSWKPWAVDKPFVNRQRILEESVDVGHFIGNILTAVGVTDEEYAAAYKAKQGKNKARSASGTYSAVKGGLGDGSDA